MKKTILLTGATDGIGLETARRLVRDGHHLLLHGRNLAKLEKVVTELSAVPGVGPLDRYVADLSRLDEVETMARSVLDEHDHIDVLINNAGVFKVREPTTAQGLDVRFVVNAIAPYLLTRRLLVKMSATGRVVNLSSAAQAPVDTDALTGRVALADFEAYAQSKLAITMWSRQLAEELGSEGPANISVNPGSMLGTKMVREGFGAAGKDVGIGADILVRAAVGAEFEGASGKYFDNDAGRFGSPHADALDAGKRAALVGTIDKIISSVAPTTS